MQPKKGDTLIITGIQNSKVPWELFETATYIDDMSETQYRVVYEDCHWVLDKDCCKIKMDNELELREGEYAVIVDENENPRLKPHGYPMNIIVYLKERRTSDGIPRFIAQPKDPSLPEERTIEDEALRPLKKADSVKHVSGGEFVFTSKAEEKHHIVVLDDNKTELTDHIANFTYVEHVFDNAPDWGEGW